MHTAFKTLQLTVKHSYGQRLFTMKSIFTILLLINTFFVLAQRSVGTNTIIKGVSIQFTYSPSVFPDLWLTAPINARGEAINSPEIERTKQIMAKTLAKYPDIVLHNELRAVYFLRSMSMYDVPFGGTNSNDALYLTNNGAENNYSDWYIEQTFHHEFSSILFRNHSSLIDTVAWKAANIAGFDYNDPEAGVGAIRNNESSQETDTALCSKGFLTQYAYSGIENDINTLAQNLFKPADGFWNIVNSYPGIKQKVNLLMKFYYRINPAFTRKFFMEMK